MKIISQNGQETARIVLEKDWSSHPLGSPESWSIVLISHLNTIFNSRQPCFLFWGEEAYCFYNDGYIPILGNEKHPAAMGNKAISIWKEIWTNYTYPQFRQAFSGNPTWNEDHFIPISRNGEIVEAYFTYGYTPIFGENGEVAGVLVTAVETTEKVVAVNQLEQAVKVTRLGFYDWNIKTNVITFNQQMQQDWGIAAGTRLEEVMEHIHADDIEEVKKAIQKTLETKSDYNCLYRVIRPDGRVIWIEAKGHLKFEGEIPVRFIGTSLDVTERQLEKQALQDSLRTRDEFLSIASHELKTPLTSLKLQLQFQHKIKKLNDPQKYNLNYLESQSERYGHQFDRLNRLVDDMLDVSRIQHGKLDMIKEEFNLSELLSEIINRYFSLFESNGYQVPVVQIVPSAVGNWDKFRIEQVIVNLLSNAIRYGEGKSVELLVTDNEHEVFLTVKDSGMGIDPIMHNRIFDRFERAVDSQKISGLGLGLYISKEVVNKHGGSLIVKSSLGHGAEFTFNLPK